MKKVVLTFGLISGGVAMTLMWATLPFIDDIGFDRGAVVGYISIVISFLFVYFGIRSYRDNVLGGRIGFGRAFGVGLLITLISSACYVMSWFVMYRYVMPDFPETYSAYVLDQAKTSGASAAEIDAKTRELATFKELYANPLVVVALSFLEPLPVGLLITLISAAVLRRKTVAGTASP